MKNNKCILNSMLLVAALSGFCDSAYADNDKIVFSGNMGSSSLVAYGTQKKENYDVAVMLADKSLKGKKISAIRAPFQSSDKISNVKVWISKKLTVESKKNVPDVMSLDATFDGNTASATLATPYTIDSDTLYVGYSFNVDAVSSTTKYPVVLVEDKSEAGFFLHTSRTYMKWKDKSNVGSSALEVDISGVEANAANISEIGTVYGQVNTTTDLTLSIKNHGYNGVKSFSYSYTAGDVNGSGQVELDKPLPAIFNASTDVTIKLDEIAAKGTYPLKLTIDKVNGEANSEAVANEGKFVVFNVMPKHNPVMEEYTGTWCGWCPRGYVALKLMNKYHSDFIGLSYHNGDAMEIMSSANFPSSVSGFPTADMDRAFGASVDPYYGASTSGFGIEDVWKAQAKKLAPAAAAVEASYKDGEKKIAAKATFVFLEDLTDADKYKVEFVLVADDLHGTGSAWEQHNYYTEANAGTMPSPEADPFFAGNSVIPGLHFDDVVVATTRLAGGLVSLPATVKADEPVEVEGEFETAKVVSTSGESLIQDTSKMRVVALLLNADGTIANAAKANVEGYTTGISTINNNAGKTDVPVAVYDAQGQRLSSMQRGVNIVKYASGKTVKVVKK